MADPKTNGPDYLLLIGEAEDALWACERLEPEPLPPELYERADAAVDRIVGHVERHTAQRLERRLHALQEPEGEGTRP
jgi:hypothetical protein